MKVEYVDHMGSDLTVVNAARVSFSNHKDVMDESDERLINFLAKHKHITPFNHPQITLRMQAPVPIRTQLFKHKVGLTENEESRRYIKTTPQLFIPDFREKPEGSIKQGSGGSHPKNGMIKDIYETRCTKAIEVYEWMIEEGVAPEQARFILPQGVEVNWYWTGSLSAFARVYNQRSDSHAQMEVRMIADMISEIIQPLFPISWKALTEEE